MSKQSRNPKKRPSAAPPPRRSIARSRRKRRPIRRPPRIAIIAAGAIIVLAAVGVALFATRSHDDKPSVAPDGVQSYPILSRSHVADVVFYPQTPPIGGPHAAIWQNCGYYSTLIANENGVHSLEHGAVWITYRPDLPAAQVQALRQRTIGQTYVLVSPYPDLPAPVVISAWGKQLTLETPDDPRLGQFIRTFREGPQTPEPGAACMGGIGQPQ